MSIKENIIKVLPTGLYNTYRTKKLKLKSKLIQNSSDKTFLKYQYRGFLGKELDLKNPETFTEKIQWLKLYDRKPEYSTMVDKYEAKKYVAEKIGEEHIIPTYGVWDKFDDIDFDKLPNQFVLKCTHDSGSVVICKDKTTFDINYAKEIINENLNKTHYKLAREWVYKNIKPRIIAEKFMSCDNQELIDYKFFCFNGEPKFLYVSTGLASASNAGAEISFFTLDWQLAPFYRKDFKILSYFPKKPAHLEEMINISKILSENIPFVRVDLYEINNQVYFSALTFYPHGGYIPFEPEEWDRKLGDLIDLPPETK